MYVNLELVYRLQYIQCPVWVTDIEYWPAVKLGWLTPLTKYVYLSMVILSWAYLTTSWNFYDGCGVLVYESFYDFTNCLLV